jgi:hypothetical protein
MDRNSLGGTEGLGVNLKQLSVTATFVRRSDHAAAVAIALSQSNAILRHVLIASHNTPDDKFRFGKYSTFQIFIPLTGS